METIYNGYISFYHVQRHFGFIACDGKSYYFFLNTDEIKSKNKELKKQKIETKFRTLYYIGDEVNFKLKISDGKTEAYDIEYIGNPQKQSLLSEAEEKQILYGYLKRIGENFFIKHISTYIFIPIRIYDFEIDIDEVYTKRVNQLLQFQLYRAKNTDALTAILVDRKVSPDWEKIREAYETQEILTGCIKNKNKKGLIVDIFGFEAFLPESQIDFKPVHDYDYLIGETMELKIVKFDENYITFIVSHKVLIEEERERQKKETRSTIEKGMIVEGHVKNITPYGVFVEFGCVDGLIHISDLSWKKVNHPNEIVKIDEKINVIILDFDEYRKRISLGLKQLTPNE